MKSVLKILLLVAGAAISTRVLAYESERCQVFAFGLNEYQNGRSFDFQIQGKGRSECLNYSSSLLSSEESKGLIMVMSVTDNSRVAFDFSKSLGASQRVEVVQQALNVAHKTGFYFEKMDYLQALIQAKAKALRQEALDDIQRSRFDGAFWL